MSFEPVTQWALRCDGDTTRGQCTQQFVYPVGTDDWDEAEESEATVWRPFLYDGPELDEHDRRDLHVAGWLLARDGRALCPRHVAGLEHLARAAVDGLPFPEFDEMEQG